MRIGKFKKIVCASLLVFGINSLANELVSTAAVKLFNLEANNDTKLLIDCNYKEKSIFGKPTYSKDSDQNEFMNYVCKSSLIEKNVIKYKNLINIINEYVKEKDFSFGHGSHLVTKDLPGGYYRVLSTQEINDFKSQKFIYNVFLEQKNFICSNKYLELKLPVLEIDTNFTVRYSFNEEQFDKKIEEENHLKYKYDAATNKVEIFEIEKPIKIDWEKTFINTYDIDSITECINGNVWVKKYGSTAGEHCNWREK